MEYEKELLNTLQELENKINVYIEKNKHYEEIFKQKEKNINIKAFKIFDSINEFKNFCKELYNVESWKITDNCYEERANILKKHLYWEQLKEEFNSKKLLNKNITNSQLVSFFDTLNLMYFTLNKIEEDVLKNEIKIIMEYVIPDMTKERVDYVICFRDNLLFIEFSNAIDYKNIKQVHKNKIEQVNQYQKNAEKYLPKNIEITTHAFIYLTENTDEKLEHNILECKNTAKIITNLIKKASLNSFEELNKLKY